MGLFERIQEIFPFKPPYQQQVDYMEKVKDILVGVNERFERVNGALESPTGTGKTMSLLCSTLYFQNVFQKFCLLKGMEEIKLRTPSLFDDSINELIKYLEEETLGLEFKNNRVYRVSKVTCVPELHHEQFWLRISERIKGNSDLEEIFCDIKEVICKFQESICLDPAKQKNEKKGSSVNFFNRIFYCTRTHEQIKNVISEMKKLTFFKHLRVCVLGSKREVCINPKCAKLKKGETVEGKCRKIRDTPPDKKRGIEGGCKYYNNVHDFKTFGKLERTSFCKERIMDIEDLKCFGKKYEMCPYFLNDRLMNKCEIVVCPYQYLIDPNIRMMKLGDSIHNSIVIFDEGHNLEDACRGTLSSSTKIKDIEDLMKNLSTCVKENIERQAHGNLLRFFEQFCSFFLERDYPNEGVTWVDKKMCVNGLLSSKDVSKMVRSVLTNPREVSPLPEEMFQKVRKLKAEYFVAEGNAIMTPSMWFRKYSTRALRADKGLPYFKKKVCVSIRDVNTIKDIVFPFYFMFYGRKKFFHDFRFYNFERKIKKEGRFIKRERTHFKTEVFIKRERDFFPREEEKVEKFVNIVCLNPACSIAEMKNMIHSFILTSGTLSPLRSFKSELDIPFQVLHEGDHVIKESQVCVHSVSMCNNTPLLGTHKTMKVDESKFMYFGAIGRCILEYCNVVPKGLLVFFKSYSMMNSCESYWMSTGLFNSIDNKKRVFLDTKDKKKFKERVKDYRNYVKKSPKGAIFFSVFRGKLSEGVNFNDDECRCVIVISVPFPALGEPSVVLKRRYNQMRNRSERDYLDGNEWYELQAFRAVNQVIGRSIRHVKDYAAVILLDERYADGSKNYRKQLSKWVGGKVVNCGDVSNSVRDMKDFFRRNRQAFFKQITVKMEDQDVVLVDSSDEEEDQDVKMEDVVQVEEEEEGEEEDDLVKKLGVCLWCCHKFVSDMFDTIDPEFFHIDPKNLKFLSLLNAKVTQEIDDKMIFISTLEEKYFELKKRGIEKEELTDILKDEEIVDSLGLMEPDGFYRCRSDRVGYAFLCCENCGKIVGVKKRDNNQIKYDVLLFVNKGRKRKKFHHGFIQNQRNFTQNKKRKKRRKF